jgi:BA14K-like protein
MMAKFPLAAAAIGIAFTVAAAPAHAQYRWHGGPGGAAVGAGIAGFAAGALLGGAIAGSRYYDYGYAPGYYDDGYAPGYYDDAYAPGVVVGPAAGNAEDYCIQRFRSYNPSTGLYLGYDGRYHPCP